jgi:hypothetical protein
MNTVASGDPRIRRVRVTKDETVADLVDGRVRGSHQVFRKAGVEERINLQRDGAGAKPYQVKQVRAVILKYRLGDRG